MEQEKILEWFCSDVDFHVKKVVKQHWYKSKYSYLNCPRPEYGLLLVVGGNVSFVTEHEAVTAQAGDLVFLPKYSRYEAVFLDEAEDYLVCFDADEDCFGSNSPMILCESVNIACHEKFRRLSDENKCTVCTQLHNKGSFLLLLDSIVEAAKNDSDKHNDIVKHACELLQKNERLTVEQIAKKCAVSPSLLRQIFIERLGVSPIRYRMDMKMRQAMYLIEATDMTVYEIAEHLSFFDAAYFCKVFRAHTGMTPKQYEKSKRL